MCFLTDRLNCLTYRTLCVSLSLSLGATLMFCLYRPTPKQIELGFGGRVTTEHGYFALNGGSDLYTENNFSEGGMLEKSYCSRYATVGHRSNCRALV